MTTTPEEPLREEIVDEGDGVREITTAFWIDKNPETNLELVDFDFRPHILDADVVVEEEVTLEEILDPKDSPVTEPVVDSDLTPSPAEITAPVVSAGKGKSPGAKAS